MLYSSAEFIMLSIKKMTPAQWYQWQFMILLLVAKGYKLDRCRRAWPVHWLGVFILFISFHSLHPLLPPTMYLFLPLHYGLHTFLVLLILYCSRLLFLLKPQELEISYQPFVPVTWGGFLCMHSRMSAWHSRIKDDLCLPLSSTKAINANTLIVMS